MRLRSTAPVAALLLTGLGCSADGTGVAGGGGGPGSTPSPDAGLVEPDAGLSAPDAGEPVDAGPSYATCSSPTPFRVVRSAAQPIDLDEDGTVDGVMGLGLTSSDYPFDVAVVRVDRRFGGPTEPGLYTLDGANFADCSLCVFIRQNCTRAGCGAFLLAREGQVEIMEVGQPDGQFTARLHGVVFEQVRIASGTGISTKVEGGIEMCVDDVAIDALVIDPSNPCPSSHVNCVQETVPDFQLMRCSTGELEWVSDIVAGDKAALFMGTAGWCGACRAAMPTIRGNDDRFSSRGLETIFVLSEDANYNPPSLRYCQQYGEQEGIADRVYMDPNFSELFRALYDYPSSSGAIGLPWFAVVDPRDMSYDWARNAPTTETMEQALNRLLNAP